MGHPVHRYIFKDSMYTTTFKMIQVEIVKVHEMKILYFYIFYIFQSILYPTDIPEPTEAVIALSAHYCTTQTAKFSSSPLTTDRRAVNTCVVCTGHCGRRQDILCHIQGRVAAKIRSESDSYGYFSFVSARNI